MISHGHRDFVILSAKFNNHFLVRNIKHLLVYSTLTSYLPFWCRLKIIKVIYDHKFKNTTHRIDTDSLLVLLDLLSYHLNSTCLTHV